MQTVATRVGRTVPSEFGGTVRAVWRRACAVAPDGGRRPAAHPAPALVTLVRDDVPMTAASVALRAGEAFEFAEAGVRVGDRVRCDGMTLVVERAGSSCSLVAEFAGAATYDGFAPERPLVTAEARAFDPALIAWVEAAGRRHRAAACGRNALAAASSAAIDALLERLSLSAAENDPDATRRAARSLVGLGPGLTPAGDDALCGLMLGRRLAGTRLEAADAAIARIASGASGRTTDVSAVQLALAANGRFGEALRDVGVALLAAATAASDSSRVADARHVRAAVVRCLAEGSTSGADALLGLSSGVRTRHPRNLRDRIPILSA